jgi:hypothetical protein
VRAQWIVVAHKNDYLTKICGFVVVMSKFIIGATLILVVNRIVLQIDSHINTKLYKIDL